MDLITGISNLLHDQVFIILALLFIGAMVIFSPPSKIFHAIAIGILSIFALILIIWVLSVIPLPPTF